LRKDGRSQRGALANNLAANAADMVKAVHRAGECAKCPAAVKPQRINETFKILLALSRSALKPVLPAECECKSCVLSQPF
jgi:hypothetical protein